jgi:formate hydrogenlyase subunit 3/multisubunit Na+/H+ antiporter MnhD subunit
MALVLTALALGGLAAAAATLPVRPRVAISSILVAAACVAAFVGAVAELRSGHVTTVRTAALLPMNGIQLRLDPLAALFVATTAVVGFAASIYAIGYAHGPLRSRTAVATFALFVTSLLAVPVASSVATLLFAWELMAVTSLLLLLTEHRHRPEALDAARWYGAMTQIGAAAILAGLLLLAAHSGGQGFGEIHAHAPSISTPIRSIAFVLVLLGFASKAGAVPLHVWLPRAHPEAPSPVSALMSGAMVSLGVYGIVRVGGDLLGGGVLWWWLVVLALGVVSALYGALHATASSDLKRLLAYSTIDSMGLVLIGVGAAGALWTTGHHSAATLSMVAALFFVVAHAAFKGCLFLAAGAAERATGTRDLDRLGGLARPMAGTTVLFCIAALSIIALPPFSGFASEWLLLQGLLHGFSDSSTATVIALLVGVVALALAAGLTAVAFVKALGIGFLGRARSPGAAQAREVAPTMRIAMVVLALPCVLLGIAPGLVIPMVDHAANAGFAQPSASPVAAGSGLDLSGFSGAIEPALLALALVAGLAATWVVLRLFASRATRRAEAWGCGREVQTARMQYTATSFGEPLQRVFTDVLRPDNDLEVTHAAESRFYTQAVTYSNRVDDAVERSLYRPIIAAAMWWGAFARRVQNGSVHRYLAFSFIALVVVLVVLA